MTVEVHPRQMSTRTSHFKDTSYSLLCRIVHTYLSYACKLFTETSQLRMYHRFYIGMKDINYLQCLGVNKDCRKLNDLIPVNRKSKNKIITQE